MLLHIPNTNRSNSGSALHEKSRIPSAPSIINTHNTGRREIVASMSEKWYNSMIPIPEKNNLKTKSNFPFDDLPPGVVVGILCQLARSNAKDPVRLGAVSKNCHEALSAFTKADKRFNETLKIFRGEYDYCGVNNRQAKTKHRYKLKRLGTMKQNTEW